MRARVTVFVCVCAHTRVNLSVRRVKQDLQTLRKELRDRTERKGDFSHSKLSAMKPVSCARTWCGVSSVVEDLPHAGTRAGTVRQSQVQLRTEA